ncbi:DUF3575 domain-containing protein [Polaribacter sp. Asnod1-A03]|uniref:DUF3575 domain-containing protein n=1 Tax=Polaribacter sp. Asnod1-A03 TaxID=3160581 RepID=UPI00386B607A
MKKIILVLGLLISSLTYSQQEIKLDFADAVIMKTLEFSYESYISDESSAGISVFFNLAKQDSNFRYNENTMITPYYRNYFTTNQQWNFFGEVWLGLNSGKEEVPYLGSDDVSYEKYTDGALGIAIGTKYISSGGFTIDLYGGIGRNLFGTDSPTIVPRLGLNIGYRL